MNIVKSALVLLELLLFVFAMFSYYRRRKYSSSESWCFAVLIVIAIYSVSIQLFFFAGIIKIYFVVDIIITILSVYLLSRYKIVFNGLHKDLVSIYRSNRLLVTLLGIIYGYLFAQVLLLPPINVDSLTYNLARVMLMIRENSIVLNNYTKLHQVNLAWGYDVLSYLFLRNYCDGFVAIFSYLCYLVIILSTYSLIINLFKDQKLAIYISVIISSLPNIVLQATSTKPDIGATACVMVMFLAGYNIIFKHDQNSFWIFLVVSLLGISFKTYFPGIAVPMVFLTIVYFLKCHSMQDLIKLTRFDKEYWLSYLLIFAIISSLSLFFYQNHSRYGSILGEPQFLQSHRNSDSVKGATINAIRYFVQTMGYSKQLGGDQIDKLIDYLSDNNKYIGARPEDRLDLTTRLLPNEDFSWYGIWGFALSVPAVVYSAFISSGYLRITAFSLLFYFISICYFVAWMPWNGRFLSLFFAGSGIHIANCFGKLILKRKIVTIIMLISLISLYYTALFNTAKPFFNLYEIGYYINEHIVKIGKFDSKRNYGFTFPGPYTFNWIYFVRNRDDYFKSMIYQNDILQIYNQKIEKNARVLLITNNVCILPFLVTRKDIKLIVANPERIYINGRYWDIRKLEDFLYLKGQFDYILSIDENLHDSLLKKNSELVYHAVTDVDYNLYHLSNKNKD